MLLLQPHFQPKPTRPINLNLITYPHYLGHVPERACGGAAGEPGDPAQRVPGQDQQAPEGE